MTERERIENALIEFYEFNRDNGFPSRPLGKTYTTYRIMEED